MPLLATRGPVGVAWVGCCDALAAVRVDAGGVEDSQDWAVFAPVDVELMAARLEGGEDIGGDAVAFDLEVGSELVLVHVPADRTVEDPGVGAAGASTAAGPLSSSPQAPSSTTIAVPNAISRLLCTSVPPG